MITLVKDKETALNKARWIFGQSVLDDAQQRVGVEIIKEAIIAYDDFSSTIMLVINGGGFGGYCLHQGNKNKTPYLDMMGATKPIGRGNVHDKLRKAVLGK